LLRDCYGQNFEQCCLGAFCATEMVKIVKVNT